MRTVHRVGAAILVVVLAGGLAACGDDDDDDAADTTTSTAAEPATVAVTASDYKFEGLPATLNAGDKLTLTNSSTAELHELVMFALPDTETRSVEDLMKLPEAELEGLFGGGEPAMVLLAPPGGGPQIAAVGDGTVATAGRYAVVCSIPTGADPEAFLNAPPSDGPPEVEGGPPHFTKGMYAEVTVE